MKSDKCSVRPPRDSSDDRGGRVQAGIEVEAIEGRSRVQSASLRPMFPVGETAGDDADDDLLCRPCEGEGDELIADGEEEQAALPGVLPNVYQPTRSEYLDHCLTNFPFRAWCKHTLEGRGREMAHSNLQGDKDSRASPVVAFDYCFLSDIGDVLTHEEFVAAGEGAAKLLIVRDSRR